MSKVDYSSWAKMSISIQNLKLDKSNPRIPSNISIRTNRDIIEYLLSNEEIKKLAEKFVKKGFISHEPIYVVKEKDSYIVLEGNRRVTALKCLLDPAIVPSSSRKYFEKLKNMQGVDLLEKVDVIVAPSREEAEDILFELHTEGKKEWKRHQKNAFIARAVVDENKTIEEVSLRFNTSISDVRTAVNEYYLSNYLSEIDLSSDIEEIALSTKFEISTLGRIIGTPHFIEITGFKIENSTLMTEMPAFRFNALLNKVVTDIVKKEATSRTLNTVESINNYIDNIIKELPEKSEDNSDQVRFIINKKDLLPSPDPAKRKSKRKEMLIPKNIIYETGNEKLNLLIQEGQKIQIGTQLYCSALLFRTIFEMSIIRIFEKNGNPKICFKDNGRTHDLSQNAKALINKEDWFESKSYLIDLRLFIAKDNNQWVALDTLNRYVHGEYVIPDKDMLKATWRILEPLVKMCT